MYRFLKNKKAQSTLEYAVLIIIVIGALLTIQVYIKRGVQGRLKQASDDIGSQFSPGNTNFVRRVTTNAHTEETFLGGVTKSTMLDGDTTREEFSSNILNVEQEFWGK